MRFNSKENLRRIALAGDTERILPFIKLAIAKAEQLGVADGELFDPLSPGEQTGDLRISRDHDWLASVSVPRDADRDNVKAAKEAQLELLGRFVATAKARLAAHHSEAVTETDAVRNELASNPIDPPASNPVDPPAPPIPDEPPEDNSSRAANPSPAGLPPANLPPATKSDSTPASTVVDSPAVSEPDSPEPDSPERDTEVETPADLPDDSAK